MDTYEKLVVPDFETCSKLSRQLVGGKAAHLSTIATLPGINVPSAMVVTTTAFVKMCEDCDIDLSQFDNHKVGSGAPFDALKEAREALLNGVLIVSDEELAPLLNKNKR